MRLWLEAVDHDLGELKSSHLDQGFGYLKHWLSVHGSFLWLVLGGHRHLVEKQGRRGGLGDEPGRSQGSGWSEALCTCRPCD